MFDRHGLEQLRRSLEAWQAETLTPAIDRLPERRTHFLTTSSEPIERLYTPLDIADLDYAGDLGLPGEYPFTRGIHPSLYRSRPWTMRIDRKSVV
jgi:methylmalonyl-CoA mutase N-terminal domain/subunit